MFSFLRKKQMGTGALLDTRPLEERIKDYKFEEIVASANPVVWVEKTSDIWRKFPIFNQNSSGSCVAQTLAKLLGVMYWLKNQIYVHFSATHIYQRRSTKPVPGMSGVEAFEIGKKGVTLEELVPSQNLTDLQMDAVQIPDYKQKVGEIFKIGNYIQLPIKDIETVASTIQTTNKAVMLWFYFKHDEWTTHPTIKYPDLDIAGAGTSRHSVTGVDYCLINGKKAIIIDDSWGTSYGVAGQRVIDEDFFKVRNFFAAYPINFVFEVAITDKPIHTFNVDLQLNMQSEEVVWLQKCLRYDGLYPINVDTTGYFGGVTLKAVKDFQIKYKISPISGYVGPLTRTKLNSLFSS